MLIVAACIFQWEWQGRLIEVAYETVGAGRAVLLLPAFSTVSSREEMRPLAEHLAAQDCGCVLVDWPGFGESTRGRLGYGPRLYHQFLADFVASVMPRGPAVIAAGHAALYVVALARDRPGVWSRAVLIAPTWRGPLPTAMGERPRAYACVRNLVGTPVIGEAIYRLNTLRSVIGLMYRRHVYSEASRVTPAFVAKKQDIARRRGARFGSAAFVTGCLDPVSSRGAFLALFTPSPGPISVFCGTATPLRSKAEMAALAERSGIGLRWVGGSLGLHEEFAQDVADPIVRFVRASSAEPMDRQPRATR
ncbi:MAG: alpha/beta hydrolase [Alphaproteobacteria bacterium]|nr:alpha/beta hydrolase [Alphaproteobacteria bacterium]